MCDDAMHSCMMCVRALHFVYDVLCCVEINLHDVCVFITCCVSGEFRNCCCVAVVYDVRFVLICCCS